jgi:hypothetical protein
MTTQTRIAGGAAWSWDYIVDGWGPGATVEDSNRLANAVVEKFHKLCDERGIDVRWYPGTSEVIGNVDDPELDEYILEELRDNATQKVMEEALAEETEADDEISKAATVMGRKGGKVKSEAKTKAARENAKKGGRPRKMNIREKLNMEWAENGGKAPSWQAVVKLMDDDIRERVHADLVPCTEAEFFAGYEDWDGGKLGDITQW